MIKNKEETIQDLIDTLEVSSYTKEILKVKLEAYKINIIREAQEKSFNEKIKLIDEISERFKNIYVKQDAAV